MKGYMKGSVNLTLNLGTLANADVLGANFADAVEELTRVSSVVLSWAMRGLTEGEGPIFVGIAHSDYTDAEIEEFLENSGSWSKGDKVQQERANRLIRRVGVFDGREDSLSDGARITTKVNWQLLAGQTVKVWAFNKSGSTLTTGAQIEVNGHANLWQK